MVSDSLKKTLNWAGDKAEGEEITLITLAIAKDSSAEVFTNIRDATAQMLAAVAADSLQWLADTGKVKDPSDVTPPEEPNNRLIHEA